MDWFGSNFKHIFITLLVGLFGALAGIGILHLYQDHVIFHGLINSIIAQQQSAAKANQTPSAGQK